MAPAPRPGPRVPESSRRDGGLPDGMLLTVIGFLLGFTVLVWSGTGLAGLLGHGRWPHDLHFTGTPIAMRELAVRPGDLAGAWSGVPRADLPRPGLFWGVFLSELLVLVVVAVFAIGTLSRWRAVRAARRTARPLPPETGPVPVPGHGHEAVPAPQPSIPAQATAPVPFPQVPQAPEREPVFAGPAPAAPVPVVLPVPAAEPPDGPLTGSHVVFTGAVRGAQGARIVEPAVLEAEGPVVVTCADDRTWTRTAAARAELGPVHVFDPEHLVDTPVRLRWAPHSGCEDPATATPRARALLAPLLTHDVTANEAAVTLLRCWLHAAAVDGVPFRQLHRWAGGSGTGDAVRILRTSREAASGWSGELEATLSAHPERRDTAQEMIRQALAGLNSVHIRDACSPGRSDGLELESFLAERGTLYVVGAPREDPRTGPSAMPLLTALVSSVVEHGRRMAAGSSPGRLDPPMTCVLDDVATTAPLPELPALMSEGPPLGIAVLAVLRSEDQARHRWPTRQAPAIWQRATTRTTL